MPRTLTAADRSALIRLASTLPAGSEERRAILAGMQRVAWGDPVKDLKEGADYAKLAAKHRKKGEYPESVKRSAFAIQKIAQANLDEPSGLKEVDDYFKDIHRLAERANSASVGLFSLG